MDMEDAKKCPAQMASSFERCSDGAQDRLAVAHHYDTIWAMQDEEEEDETTKCNMDVLSILDDMIDK